MPTIKAFEEVAKVVELLRKITPEEREVLKQSIGEDMKELQDRLSLRTQMLHVIQVIEGQR